MPHRKSGSLVTYEIFSLLNVTFLLEHSFLPKKPAFLLTALSLQPSYNTQGRFQGEEIMVSDSKQKRRRSRRIARLPQELVTEILLRLPIRSLVRSKCVCKEWFTLINDDPQFAKSQLQQSASGIIGESSKPGIFSYFSLDVKKEQIDFNIREIVKDDVTLQDSCNGLLLLKRENCVEQYYICNPITKWYLKLPQFLFLGDDDQHWWSSLAYDNSNQKYKVVITYWKPDKLLYDPMSYKCGVFTILGNKDGGGDGDGSSSGSWRELDIPAPYELAPCCPCFANGALHWMANGRPEDMDEYILLMELANEEFRVINSPLPPIEWPSALLKMKGSLCIAHSVSDQLDLWVLNDHVKQKWVKKFSINVEVFAGKNSWLCPCFVMGNPRPVLTFFCTFNEDYAIYDLDIGQFKFERKGIDMGRSSIIAHVNSLISC
ncbi:F-box protein At5g49610-like [Macadamia integrifolia]|uniref:F-box protein At5g49610-like n=1 Tax=Macadamia integrifolia TaxID=60698 RepID=UPI001C501A61|nr:F-box protein At5g49610-like [Macadamia integrifolia]